MDWHAIEWGKVLNYASLASIIVCGVINIWVTIRVYRSGKRAVKANREFIDAMEKAMVHLKANPQAWLDHMAAMDDKRRQH